VFKHEHFGELCASASVGQASPKELFELEQHAAQCEACTRAYWEYLNLAGRQFAASGQTPSLSPRESQDCLNSDLFTRRFFERAEKEGIGEATEMAGSGTGYGCCSGHHRSGDNRVFLWERFVRYELACNANPGEHHSKQRTSSRHA